MSANGWSTAYYNHGFTGGHTQLAPFGNPSAFATPDTTGLATSASVGVAGNGSGYPHDPGTYDSLSASADLATATQSMSEMDTGINDYYTGYDGGTTFSELRDQLTFNVAGATSSTVTTIGYTAKISGMLRQSGSSPTGHGEVVDAFGLVGAGVGGYVDIQLNDVGHGGVFAPYVNGTGGSGTYVTSTPDLVVQTGTFNILGSSLGTSFAMDQSTWAYSGMRENYTQTVKFSLPTGVTIASSSGVFGRAAVPGPSALAMFGISLFAAARRRSR